MKKKYIIITVLTICCLIGFKTPVKASGFDLPKQTPKIQLTKQLIANKPIQTIAITRSPAQAMGGGSIAAIIKTPGKKQSNFSYIIIILVIVVVLLLSATLFSKK